MMQLSYPALLLMVFVWAVCGFVVGRYWERAMWNRLIDDGVIPAPKKYNSGKR